MHQAPSSSHSEHISCAAALLGDSAAEIRRSYSKGEDEALDKFVHKILSDGYRAFSELLYHNQRGILRLEQWSDGLLRCSNSFRFHVPDRSPTVWFQGGAAGAAGFLSKGATRRLQAARAAVGAPEAPGGASEAEEGEEDEAGATQLRAAVSPSGSVLPLGNRDLPQKSLNESGSVESCSRYMNHLELFLGADDLLGRIRSSSGLA
ncbi:hypothetical protein THAOC_00367 [Thalassiosira oceanica]|uniref:Uncharacterized protein n=1 Tax=Thalassiosira oceanica TaxID=159749 RepID=K3W4E1_THAOC|nr:hypothetical protein THAOC_00367 [Thalassiosira oceanica]|eukprot:EJK77779.1 hypothetical protein THAOC_00367 [Thalassiosira oceanica]